MATEGVSSRRSTSTAKQRRRGNRAVAATKAKMALGGTAARQQIVEREMKKRYGTANWRKYVYGKNYKGGTVGNLNKRVKTARGNQQDVVGKIKTIQKELASATGETQKALERRLQKAQTNKATISRNISGSKSERDKYLKLRNKAVASTVRKFAENPKSAEAARKKVVTKQLEQAKKRQKNKKGKNVAEPA